MAEDKICPFQSFGAREQTEVCARDDCALWIRIPDHEETGACTFSVMAARLSTIEDRLHWIAEKAK